MYSYLRASERGRSIELLEGVLICGRAKDRWIQQNAKLLMVYYIHFKITGDSCNLISSHWCDLFTNRTIFCSKSHLFPSQWGKFTKMQPVACLKKPNKVKVRRTNLVALWLSVVNQTQSNHEDQSQQRRALQCSLYVVSSNSKSKQANCLKRGKTWVTSPWLALVLPLIGWEGGVSFLDQSQIEVKYNQYNLGLLSTLAWKLLCSMKRRGILLLPSMAYQKIGC